MVKRKVVLFFAVVFLFAASGCSIVPASLFAEASPTATAVRNVLATRPVIPTPITPASRPTAAPSWTPEVMPIQTETVLLPPTAILTPPSADGFCCLQFGAGPLGQATGTFPAGTEIVYAIWDYASLAPGDRVRRIWIRDGLIWLTREEKWDWGKYGADGTVRDLSIFDFEGSGLQSAEYRLQLYLNDVLQQEGVFVILPPGT